MTDIANAAAPAPRDLSAFDAVDKVEWDVTYNGELIGWTWTFAGPGHDATIAFSEQLSRDAIARRLSQEKAQINGKKWQPPEEDPEDNRRRNVDLVARRLLGWSPYLLDGQPLPFSLENARKLLLDRKKPWLMSGALDFLGDEKTFMKRSAKSS